MPQFFFLNIIFSISSQPEKSLERKTNDITYPKLQVLLQLLNTAN